MPQSIEVIVNAGSGSVECEAIEKKLTELFETNGVTAKIHLAKGGADIIGFGHGVSFVR